MRVVQESSTQLRHNIYAVVENTTLRQATRAEGLPIKPIEPMKKKMSTSSLFPEGQE